MKFGEVALCTILLINKPSFRFATYLSENRDEAGHYENQILLKEEFRILSALQSLKLENIRLIAYYHTSTWRRRWPHVVEEQLRLMDGSSSISNRTCLLSFIEKLYINVAGSHDDYMLMCLFIDSLNLNFQNKISIRHVLTIGRYDYMGASEVEQKYIRRRLKYENISIGEHGTLTELHAFCKGERERGQRTFILYSHSKGLCCPKNSGEPDRDAVADWRETLNTFTIEYPSTCIRSLLDGYAACGANFGPKYMYFVGNMWWADCNHIAALPGLWDPFEFIDHENFIVNTSSIVENRHGFAQHCFYQPYSSPVYNLYDERTPRIWYLPVLHRLLTSDNLPPNPSAIVTPYSTWAELTCSRAYERPYADQPSWVDSSQLWWRRRNSTIYETVSVC